MSVVVFPDAELWAVGYVRAALADSSVFVGNVDGSTTKTKRVVIRRDGGPQTSPVTEVARLGVRVFAPSEQAATDLARLVQAHLAASTGEGPVRRYRGLSGPSSVADPAGPMRYLTCELTVVGTAL